MENNNNSPKKRRQRCDSQEERESSHHHHQQHERNGDLSPCDVLHLNVGGTLTAVLRRTLTSVEGSLLASRFSGRWDESIEKDRDGNYFIDQPIELFLPMINYLRAKNCETTLAPPVTSPEFDSEEKRHDFVRMVEYYGMTSGIFPTVMEMCRGVPGSAEICGQQPNLSVTSPEWATFTLETRGHKRPIMSFSVVLGNVQRAQIGWVRPGHFVKKLRPGDHKGVGEERFSFGLDCFRGGLLYEGSFNELDGLATVAGTVIRCENRGERWLVNGHLVASSIALEETFQLPPDLQQYFLIPAISGKGDWKVCQVELDPIIADHKSVISHAHR